MISRPCRRRRAVVGGRRAGPGRHPPPPPRPPRPSSRWRWFFRGPRGRRFSCGSRCRAFTISRSAPPDWGAFIWLYHRVVPYIAVCTSRSLQTPGKIRFTGPRSISLLTPRRALIYFVLLIPFFRFRAVLATPEGFLRPSRGIRVVAVIAGPFRFVLTGHFFTLYLCQSDMWHEGYNCIQNNCTDPCGRRDLQSVCQTPRRQIQGHPLVVSTYL